MARAPWPHPVAGAAWHGARRNETVRPKQDLLDRDPVKTMDAARGRRRVPHQLRQRLTNKSFLVLFFKKEQSSL
jgi:hypothetical protein